MNEMHIVLLQFVFSYFPNKKDTKKQIKIHYYQFGINKIPYSKLDKCTKKQIKIHYYQFGINKIPYSKLDKCTAVEVTFYK
jgi:hypothetical protein